jgi:endo-1,4-beta-D-glucanase Y
MSSYDPYPDHTVSEGQAYGMLLAVYFNDKTTFDKLLNYQAVHRNSNGLMMWHLDASGNASGSGGSNSASDADLDIAFALLKAEQRWPGNSYGAIGATEVNKIATKELNGARNLLPGDWALGNDPGWTYVSYFIPAWFRTFATVGDAATWNSVLSVNNTTMTSGRNATTGLVGETTYYGGGAGPTDGTQ